MTLCVFVSTAFSDNIWCPAALLTRCHLKRLLFAFTLHTFTHMFYFLWVIYTSCPNKKRHLVFPSKISNNKNILMIFGKKTTKTTVNLISTNYPPHLLFQKYVKIYVVL